MPALLPPLAVSNRSRPLASRRKISSLPKLTGLFRVSNRSRPLASRRTIRRIPQRLLRNRFQSIASPSEQENTQPNRETQTSLRQVSNRSRPLASRRLSLSNRLIDKLTLFPIDRVPQRVGDKFISKTKRSFVVVSNRSRPLASRRTG